MRRVLFACLGALAVAAAVLLGATLIGTPPAQADTKGATRLPAICIANIYESSYTPLLQTLSVGIWTPQYPAYWDVTPPEGSWAYSSGWAVLTPSGALNINCDHSDGLLVGDGLWPIGTTTQRIECGTALGGDPLGYGAKIYSGRGTVTVSNSGQRAPGSDRATYGSTTVNCHAEYLRTNPGPG